MGLNEKGWTTTQVNVMQQQNKRMTKVSVYVFFTVYAYARVCVWMPECALRKKRLTWKTLTITRWLSLISLDLKAVLMTN